VEIAVTILRELGENIALAKDLVFNAIDFDFASAVLAENHLVPNADAQRRADTVIEQFAWSDGDDFAPLWLLFGAIRQKDTTGSGFFGFERLDNDTIIERTDVYFCHINHL
jgi:hypothetical protein